MTDSAPSRHHLVIPDEAISEQAAPALEALEQFLERHPQLSEVSLSLVADQDEIALALPVDVLKLLVYILVETANANAVTVSSVESELTTQQAADMLNVSRPYLVKLLDERKIPFRRVGNRRRLLLADILAFKDRDESERRAIAAELTAEAERHAEDG